MDNSFAVKTKALGEIALERLELEKKSADAPVISCFRPVIKR